MARNIRLEVAGGFYHVMARGNRRAAIFVDDDDRRFFLKCLAEACEKTGWLVHAWVLMGNHYHLFIETPEPNLVDGMKWLQNTVTRRFNIRHREWGRLFGDRYKAMAVEGDSLHYYETLWDYIHLNPSRAGLVDATRGQSVLDYPWSSLVGGYGVLAPQRPPWLAATRSLAILGVEDSVEGRRALIERLDKRAAEERERSGWVTVDPENDKRGSHLRRGWYWGSQAFAERLLRLGSPALKKNRHSRAYAASPERLAHGEQEAARLLAEGLQAAGLTETDLAASRCSNPSKVLLATLLWKTTTVPQGWIAEHLMMQNAANVSRVIHRSNLARLLEKAPEELGRFVKGKMGENAH